MKEILDNLALVTLNEYALEHSLPISNSHLYKFPRKWMYALKDIETKRTILTVTFYKNRIPSFNPNHND